MGNVEDTLTLGWNSAASNFNLFVVPDTSFAFERGPNIGQSFFSWKSATGGDGNSYTGLNSYIPSSNLFTGTSLGNLNIINTNTECWHSYGKGVQIPAVNTDYSGNTRSITIADGPTCIGSNEFNTNSSVNLPPVTAVVPVSNTTTACVFDGRNLMDLTWGTGVLPATVNIKYYSGKIVPDTLTGMVTGKSYWHVRPNIQPESAYNIKINFGAFETGKIPFLSDIILAKLDSVSGVWSSYPRGTTGNGVSIIDTVNQTITVNGITGLGIFTLLDKNTVLNQFSMNLKLLFEGSYFDGGKPGYLVPDTVTVFLIDSALGWVKTDSVGVIIDSLGQGSFVTTKVTLGSNYYIRVKNSKTMETWSATGNNTFSPATGNLTYDFTTAKANAYGGNQVLKNSKWCIFSGDVNQDAFVDGSDVALVDNDAYNGLLGWRNTDLNGDLFIDGSDLSSCDNNAFNGVIINRPPGFPGTLVNNPITVKANKAIEKIKNENDGPEANEFTLSVTDLMQNSSDSLTFRIYLKNTSATRKEFASGQYYFDFNPSILNGGTGILRLLSSDLSVTNQAPRNPTVILSPPQLVFRTNAVPGAGFGKLINAGDSVLVAYASLKTTTGAFSPLNTGMSWTTFMSGNPQRTKIFYYIENLNTEVSQNGIYYNPEDSPLPVEISSFSANVIKRDINLNWTTNREMNNEGFEVQRSLVIDGISKNDFKWEKAGYVPGKGNSLSNQNYSFSQKNQNSGKYSYRLKQIDYNGNFEYFYLKDYVNIGIPVKFDLSQNYPNPFNPVTKINYDLSRDSKVTIKIYDISGREVYTLINESLAAGYYTAEFNASNLSSGVYFYQIIAQGSKDRFVMNKKMMLIK